MLFTKVALASIGRVIPSEEISSQAIEVQLRSVYERLRLPEGRLEGMSGIAARRIWRAGTRLSDCSIQSCRNAIEASRIHPGDIGCLIHASVCREYLEPATACRVHHHVGLPENCWVYDLSNACLGVMNGAVQIAQLIESNVIRAGIVVGTEDSRGLLKATIDQLNSDTTLTRQTIKPAFASLTIGSGSCAWLLVDREWWQSRRPNAGSPIHAAVARARTEHHGLCQSDTDQAGASMQPTMNTDSEMLLEAGVATGKTTFEALLRESQWDRKSIDVTVCHQVGAAHRRRMLDALELDARRDFSTFATLGNTGSVALSTALGMAIESQFVAPESRVALLGIGSGVNSVMIGMSYQRVDTLSTLQ